MITNYEAALDWHSNGYNVVPQASDGEKHPAVKWKPLQGQRATPEKLLQWKSLFKNGLGFITGDVSGVIVIETDGLAGETALDEFEHEYGPLPETRVIRSGSHRGFHYHFKHPRHQVKTIANPSIKVDVKGDGGFCVLPPSQHKSGNRYEVVHEAEPAKLPPKLLEFIRAKAQAAGARKGAAKIDGWFNAKPSQGVDISNNSVFGAPPPCVDTMKAMLLYLAARNCFEHRQGTIPDAKGRITKVGWIDTGMALKQAYGDKDGIKLWELTHIDDGARNDAPRQWASFAPTPQPGHITIGTIIRAAKDAGFAFAAKRTAATSGYISYGPFTMDAKGLEKNVRAGSGNEQHIKPAWISSPFEIRGACRDPSGRSWGKLIAFRDADNRQHTRHIPDAALHGEPAGLCAALADEGLRICRPRQRDLVEYLSGAHVTERVTIVGRTGWHQIGREPVFVLPAETIAPGAGEAVVLDAVAQGPYEARGSLDDWKHGVGTLTAGHTVAVLMVSAALAGPLMHLVGAEGGGVHLYGPSSIGKSAILAAAASFWGRGSTPGYVRSWRATANGIEGAAASATDTCLVLDEIGVSEARDVAASVYTLANGSGKQRATRDGSLREPRSWRVIVLSSGELPVESKLVEDRGRKIRAGQLVRLLDIPADRRLGFGAFDHAGGSGDAGKLADAIKRAASTAYGTAGSEFVRTLIARGVEQLVPRARKFMADFVGNVAAPGASEQVTRAANKLALIALAGEVATQCGITPWQKGDAREAAEWAFARWVERRGGTGSHEERQAIEKVRLIIEQHGEARFEPLEGSPHVVRDRLGWRKGDGPDREWFVLPQSWKDEVCDGLDPVFVARTLAKHKMLRRQGVRKDLTWRVRIGGRPTRGYVLTAAILDGSP